VQRAHEKRKVLRLWAEAAIPPAITIVTEGRSAHHSTAKGQLMYGAGQ